MLSGQTLLLVPSFFASVAVYSDRIHCSSLIINLDCTFACARQLVSYQIMSIDQFNFWIAFFEENYALQHLLATFKVAGIGSRPDPCLKLVMIVAGIASEKNLVIDAVDQEDYMSCAVPT